MSVEMILRIKLSGQMTDVDDLKSVVQAAD
jgi:hypothetical protein